MEKINVLQVCSRLGLGGTEKNLQIFTKYLDKHLFNVYVCVFVGGGEREKMLKDMGIKIHVIDRSQKKLIKLIRSKNIHVVYMDGKEEPFVTTTAQKAGVPLMVRDISGRFENPETAKSIDRHLVSKMCALRFRKWNKITSEEFHKRCCVIYDPIDLEEVKEYGLSRKEILQKRKYLGIKQGDLVIGRAGRADIGKWGNIIIDMMPHLIKKVPNVKCIILGIPESKKEEIEKKKLAKYFIFLENVPSKEIVEFYNWIDILTHSSGIGESFGRTVAEAMACKKPIVVDSTPLVDNAQIELVDNGKTGFVVYSPKAFAEAIAYLASNREVARKMGLAGYAKVKREYEAKKVTRVLEKRIIEFLRRKGMEVPKKVLKRYEKVHYSPSSKEIDNFELEYRRRLKDCFDKPDLIKLFVYKYVVSKPLMLKVVKSVRLTNLRNMIMRFRERWR